MEAITTNFTSRQEMEETMQNISKEKERLQGLCDSITVSNPEEMNKAADIAIQVKARLNRIEELRVAYVKPLNDHVKKINSDFKKAAEPFLNFESFLKGKISVYRMEQERIATEERKRLEAERRAEADRIAKEEGMTRREALAQIEKPVVEAEVKSASTESGKVVTKMVWKFEVVNTENVPAEYKVVDEKLIRKAVQAGARRIAGVRIYEEAQTDIQA